MLGPEAAADALVDLLRTYLPAKTVEVLDRLEPTRPSLAERRRLEPKFLEAFDPFDLPADKYPAAYVLADRLVGLVPVDVITDGPDRGQLRYASTYELRVFGWARGVDAGTTPEERGRDADRNRKRFTLAIREVLLEHLAAEVTIGRTPGLEEGDDGYRPGTTVAVTIDAGSLSEAYSDVVADDVSTLAASFVQLRLTLEEHIPAGTAAVEVTEVTIHPALRP